MTFFFNFYNQFINLAKLKLLIAESKKWQKICVLKNYNFQKKNKNNLF